MKAKGITPNVQTYSMMIDFCFQRGGNDKKDKSTYPDGKIIIGVIKIII